MYSILFYVILQKILLKNRKKPSQLYRQSELSGKYKREKEDINLVNQKRNEEKNRKLKREGAKKGGDSLKCEV